MHAMQILILVILGRPILVGRYTSLRKCASVACCCVKVPVARIILRLRPSDDGVGMGWRADEISKFLLYKWPAPVSVGP